MQQTTKYQFNLVDTTDDFSPTPLNQNMEKVEEELSGLSTALTQGLEEVEDSVSALEDSVDSQLAAVTAALGTGGSNARVTYGSYTGTGTYGSDNPITLNCPFKPLAVVIQSHYQNSRTTVYFIRNMTSVISDAYQQYTMQITWNDQSVSFYSDGSQFAHFNAIGGTYHYVILGYSEET